MADSGSGIFTGGIILQLVAGVALGLEAPIAVVVVLGLVGFWMAVIGAGAWAVEIGTRPLLDAHEADRS